MQNITNISAGGGKLRRLRRVLRAVRATAAAFACVWVMSGMSVAWAVTPVYATSASGNRITFDENTYTVGNDTKSYSDSQYQVQGGSGDNVSDNKVTINTSSKEFTGIIAGFGNNNVSNNTVEINKNATIDVIFGGTYTTYNTSNTSNTSGSVTENKVYINDGSIMMITGGQGSTVTENKVYINGGNVTGIVGGISKDGKSNKNEVHITGGTVSGSVIGGESYNGNSEGNIITVEKNGEVNGTIIGGTVGSDSGSALNNIVNIDVSNLSLTGLRGGITTGSGNSSGNKLNISGKNIKTNVLDGFQKFNFKLPSNISTGETILSIEGYSTATSLTDATIDTVDYSATSLTEGDSVTLISNDNGITVADSLDGTTLSNDVTIKTEKDSSGLITKIVAYIGDNPTPVVIYDKSSKNTITITDTKYTKQNASGDTSTSDTVNHDGTYGESIFAGVVGEESALSDKIYSGNATDANADANNNAVNVESGTITGTLTAAQAVNGNANNNEITITGGTVNDILAANVTGTGGASNNNVTINGDSTVVNGTVYAAKTASGNVTNNNVTINSGTLNSNIYGGYSTSGSVSGNSVELNGGFLQNINIYGGYSESGSATGNKITISGSPDLSGSNLYGSNTAKDGSLIIKTTGLTANNIYNFNNIEFYIPQTTKNGDTVLTLTDSAGTDLTGVTFSGGFSNDSSLNKSVSSASLQVTGDTNINDGDSYDLIVNENGGLKLDDTLKTGTLSQGIITDYELNFTNSGGRLKATVGNQKPVTEEKEIVEEGHETNGTIALNATDFIYKTEVAIENENNSGDAGTNSGDSGSENDSGDKDSNGGDEKSQTAVFIPIHKNEWNTFLTSGGSWMRSDGTKGSYSDSKVFGFNLGMSRSFCGGGNRFMIAPLLDYGRGSYDSYLDDGTHGSGNQKYWAGGFLFRQTHENGFYYGGSFRYGRMLSDFSTNDIIYKGQRTHMDYDVNSNYWAGHIDIGRLIDIDRENSLDIYGIYFHGHVNSADSTGINTGNADTSGGKFHFNSLDNDRIRIGARLNRRVNPRNLFYSGLAYQYEHADASESSFNGTKMPNGGSVSGSSGMLELGWIVKPHDDSPMALNVSATGWAGHQRGVSVQAKFEQAF